MKRIVVFSGAGMSAESGLKTFRDTDGLWEKYDINEVATPEAWAKNPELVLDFYNQRRNQIVNASPNRAHYAIARLESRYDVCIVTQNIDDLHERAGSTNVLHLHGEICKAKSVKSESPLYDISDSIQMGDLAPDGAQLRPHVVWFGEAVPEYENAQAILSEAEILIIVGTSLNVYPAAGLIHFAPPKCLSFLVDPNSDLRTKFSGIEHIQETATVGVPMLVERLLMIENPI